MKIRVLSDLHLEHAPWRPPSVPADVIVLAGDIHVGTQGLPWARRHFPHTPIVYVAGNHEFHNGRVQDAIEALRNEGQRRGIHVLEKDEITIDGVRFLGATLWTDFKLQGADPAAIDRAMAFADESLADFNDVKYGDAGRFQASHARDIHRAQARWLKARLRRPHAGPTIVVTHHLPHRNSVHPRFAGHPLTPSFASNLDSLVHPPVTLWVHGHTHDSMDYVVNGTRVVCNPRGYARAEPNRAFNPDLLIEVPSSAVTSLAV